MKLNKLICSLIIGGSVSLSVTGCIPNAGDDNDPSRLGNNAMQANNTVATAKSFPTDAKTASNYVVKGIIGAAFDMPLGFKKLAVNTGIDFLMFLIFGPATDPNKPILDKLDSMDKKLDDIIGKVDVALAIGSISKQTLDSFYKAQMTANVQNTLAEIVNDNNAVKAKYLQYKDQKIFGDFTATQPEELFNYAKNNCHYSALMAIDAMNAKEIATDKASTSQLKSINSSMNTYELYSNYKTKYKDSQNAGSIFNRLLARKKDYIKSLNSISSNGDLMDFVSYYNQQILINQAELFTAYQEMYNMQLAQLTYKYACGADIRMDNINLRDIKATGVEGFLQAKIELNKTYDKQFEEMLTATKSGLSVIDNQDLYEIINNNIFKSERPFLSEDSFAIKNNKINQCSVTSLKFIPVSTGNNQDGTGLAKLAANCITSDNDKQTTAVKVYQEVPYYQAANSIQRYAMSGIYFDKEKLSLQVKDKDSTANTIFSKDDVGNMCAAKDFSNRDDLGNTVDMANTSTYRSGGSAYLYWFGSNIDLDSDLYLLSNMYTPELKHDDQSDYWWNYRDFPRPKDFFLQSGYKGKISYPTSQTYSFGQSGNETDNIFARWNWYIANYDEKTFCIKTGFVYTNEKISLPGERTGWAIDTLKSRAVLGIGCLDSNCKRASPSQLQWGDGTIVKLDGSIKSDSKGSWKINGTNLNPDSIVVKKFKFTEPQDYKNWQQNGTIGSNYIYLDGKISLNEKQIDEGLTKGNGKFVLLSSPTGKERMLLRDLGSRGIELITGATVLYSSSGADKLIEIKFINGDIRLTLKNKSGAITTQNLFESAYKQRKIKWITDPYAKIEMQDDRNLVIYSSDSSGQIGYAATTSKGRVIWASGTGTGTTTSSNGTTEWGKIDNGTFLN